MSRISLGILCGLAFGALDTALMIPLSFPGKRAAMLGAFIARFGLGFVICNIWLPWPGWVRKASRHRRRATHGAAHATATLQRHSAQAQPTCLLDLSGRVEWQARKHSSAWERDSCDGRLLRPTGSCTYVVCELCVRWQSGCAPPRN